MRTLSSLLLTMAFVVTAAFPAYADDWRGHGDIHGFYGHGYDHWRGGNWYNGFHEGRNGWWWIVDGSWYFYPAPIYPYPDPYTPPTVVVEQAPVALSSAPPTFVYYCTSPAGYYPYVAECTTPWQKVESNTAPPLVAPTTPAGQAAPPPPAANQHDADYEQLNAYADEFAHIDVKDPHARTQMKNLEKRVEIFHKSLFERDYNAMDTLKNTEDLEHRIAAQREKLSSPPAVTTPSAQ